MLQHCRPGVLRLAITQVLDAFLFRSLGTTFLGSETICHKTDIMRALHQQTLRLDSCVCAGVYSTKDTLFYRFGDTCEAMSAHEDLYWISIVQFGRFDRNITHRWARRKVDRLRRRAHDIVLDDASDLAHHGARVESSCQTRTQMLGVDEKAVKRVGGLVMVLNVEDGNRGAHDARHVKDGLQWDGPDAVGNDGLVVGMDYAVDVSILLV